MFKWFRRYIRKVEVFGVKVEFRPPPDTSSETPASGPVAATLPAPEPKTPIPGDGDHGSDSTKWVKWPPTPEVIQIRRKYKDLIWLETDPSRIRQRLYDYWAEEQRAFGEDRWGKPAEQAFFRAVNRVKDKHAAIRVIENVQANKY